jgi:hypothetical protein
MPWPLIVTYAAKFAEDGWGNNPNGAAQATLIRLPQKDVVER